MEAIPKRELLERTIVLQPCPRPCLSGFALAACIGGIKYVFDLYWGQTFSWPAFLFTVGIWTVAGALYGLIYSTQNICLDQSGIITGSGPSRQKTLWKDVGSYELIRRSMPDSPLWKRFLRGDKPILKFHNQYGKEINRAVLRGGTPEEIEDAVEYVKLVLGEPKDNNDSREFAP